MYSINTVCVRSNNNIYHPYCMAKRKVVQDRAFDCSIIFNAVYQNLNALPLNRKY